MLWPCPYPDHARDTERASEVGLTLPLGSTVSLGILACLVGGRLRRSAARHGRVQYLLLLFFLVITQLPHARRSNSYVHASQLVDTDGSFSSLRCKSARLLEAPLDNAGCHEEK